MTCPKCHTPTVSAENGTLRFCPSCREIVGEGAQMPPVVVEGAVRGAGEAVGGKAAGVVHWLNLPYPLTTNNLYRTGKNGRRYKTNECLAYHEEAGKAARTVFRQPLSGRLSVGIVISPKRGVGMDLDNACKCCLDSLTGVVWNDDSQIWRLVVERTGPVQGGSVVMSVEEYQGAR